jgi:MFS family permease
MVAILVLRAGPQAMGLLAAAGLIAYAVAGLGAGVLVDRAPKRPLMIAADLGRALVMLAVPLAAVSGWLTLAGVFVALALISALSAIFEMADHAFLPSLIDASRLVDGNAKLGTTDAVAEFGGPALAGVLVQVLTAAIAVGATAATYLASAVCLTAVRTPEMLGEAPEAERPAATPADFDVLRGVRAVLAHPIVRPIWLMSMSRDFFGWFYGALYAFYALEVLRLSPAQVGVSVAAGGLGGIVGAPLVALTFLIVAQLFGDALQTAREIGKTSLRQALIPATELGRAAGAFAAAAGLAGVAGALTGGSLGAAIGARETLFSAAAGGAVVPLIGLLSPLWRARVATSE